MRVLILGAAGFIGTNLTIALMKNADNKLTLVDKDKDYFAPVICFSASRNVQIVESQINPGTDFSPLVKNQDIVYHLISTTVPATQNVTIQQELSENILMTSSLLDACVAHQVKRIVFLSSGGTVYGKVSSLPIAEDTSQLPISAYGLQKTAIEKLLHLYYHMYGLDYRIIRLSNPYGPYQKSIGVQGVISTFLQFALDGKQITVYGKGDVVRDFIFIDDAVAGIIDIANANSKHRVYNLGCGYGTSINDVINLVRQILRKPLNIQYLDERAVDVPVNYLNISRFLDEFGPKEFVGLEAGLIMTADFLKKSVREKP